MPAGVSSRISAFVFGNTPASGVGKLDELSGEMTMTRTIQVGVASMIASIVALTAHAADMRRSVYKAAPAVTVFNWTGCYGGG